VERKDNVFSLHFKKRIIICRVLIMENKKVDEYIEKQKSLEKEICIELRKIIFKTFPDIKEKMKWGVPSYAGGNYYFVTLKNHVNLGFSIKRLPKEKIALFQGSGKTMRIIEIKSEKEINEKQIVKLLKLIQEK
jgi:hypothetical protein